ncbi:MAG: hypothetical protein OXI43_13970 [Candidatus Poribacteria bacterium]|nr:hypothetical protein [Candidatus Poribacteria bacterium]
MKKRTFLILIFGCISLAALYLLMTQIVPIDPPQDIAKTLKQQSGDMSVGADNLKDVPYPTDAWETWLSKQTDIVLEEMLRYLHKNRPWEIDDFEREIEENEADAREKLEEMMAVLKEDSDTPPPLRIIPLEELFDLNESEPDVEKYEGPQTAEAIVENFEGMLYTTSDIEATYPENDFIQMLLDRGITIDDYGDYSGYMHARYDLHWLDQNPDRREWFAFANGVEYTDDLETLKGRFLDAGIRKYEQLRDAIAADPRVIGGFHKGDKFLPMVPGRVYVQLERHSDGSLSKGVMGEELTEAEKFNIFYRGIEPRGYEIVYLDSNHESLQEPFQSIKPVEVLSPDKYEEYLNRRKGTEDKRPNLEEYDEFFREKMAENDDFYDTMPPDLRQFEQAQFERSFHEEQDQFMQAMEELVEWSSMSDTEIASEFEKMLIENQLREHFTSKPVTPQRIEQALKTLHQHGPGAGINQLRGVDPDIAHHLEQRFKQERSSTRRSSVPDRYKSRRSSPPTRSEVSR